MKHDQKHNRRQKRRRESQLDEIEPMADSHDSSAVTKKGNCPNSGRQKRAEPATPQPILYSKLNSLKLNLQEQENLITFDPTTPPTNAIRNQAPLTPQKSPEVLNLSINCTIPILYKPSPQYEFNSIGNIESTPASNSNPPASPTVTPTPATVIPKPVIPLDEPLDLTFPSKSQSTRPPSDPSCIPSLMSLKVSPPPPGPVPLNQQRWQARKPCNKTLSRFKKCYNCGEYGHPWKTCSLPKKKFCTKCGRQGVTIAKCVTCQDEYLQNYQKWMQSLP